MMRLNFAGVSCRSVSIAVHNHTSSAMPSSPDVLVAARRHQMFPVLEASEIGRIARLGERRTYAAGSDIFTTGEVAVGAFVLLSGRVDITQDRKSTRLNSS